MILKRFELTAENFLEWELAKRAGARENCKRDIFLPYVTPMPTTATWKARLKEILNDVRKALSRVRDLGPKYDGTRDATATNRPLFTAYFCSLSPGKTIERKEDY